MDSLKSWGVHYISNREIALNDAVMFDIDDTLIFTDGEPNKPIIELLHEARDMTYKIIIITARPPLDHIIERTMKQLYEYGIRYDYIGFTSPLNKGIMKQQLPYNFILSVGDMPTDLTDSQHVLNISNFFHS